MECCQFAGQAVGTWATFSNLVFLLPHPQWRLVSLRSYVAAIFRWAKARRRSRTFRADIQAANHAPSFRAERPGFFLAPVFGAPGRVERNLSCVWPDAASPRRRGCRNPCALQGCGRPCRSVKPGGFSSIRSRGSKRQPEGTHLSRTLSAVLLRFAKYRCARELLNEQLALAHAQYRI